MSDRETIFAIASGQGIAGVTVIRISGSDSWDAIHKITSKGLPDPRILSRRWIVDSTGQRIDDALVVVFRAGASFTGEDSAEIQCHGSRAVISAIMAELAECQNCREAEPGEFTRRAFETGQMDLNEVEGLGDLIKAETEYQRRHALRVMSGAATDQISHWRADLIRARALIEVTIDWADEEVPEDVSPEVKQIIEKLASEIQLELQKFQQTERLREGFEVAIVGPPNSGKSSLLNAIAGRDVAITSEIAGTTRDVIETRCDLGGLPVTFLDTAGLRETTDTVEQIGVNRARRRAESADLRIFLKSSDTDQTDLGLGQSHDILVWSKADLDTGEGDVVLSSKTGQGVAALVSMVTERLSSKITGLGLFGHRRQFRCLQRCLRSVGDAKVEMSTVDPEVLAEHLRTALAELDSMSGRNGVEAVLGEVFSSFCLGK